MSTLKNFKSSEMVFRNFVIIRTEFNVQSVMNIASDVAALFCYNLLLADASIWFKGNRIKHTQIIDEQT